MKIKVDKIAWIVREDDESLQSSTSTYDNVVAPTVNDDTTEWYVVWSKWIDITSWEIYEAVDVTDWAAIWKNVSWTASLAADISTDTTNFDWILSIADTTVQAALDTIDDWVMTNPMVTQWDTIYGGASWLPTRLAKWTASQVFTMNAWATAPEWATAWWGWVIEFTWLNDTPSSYLNQWLKWLRVNELENWIEYHYELPILSPSDAELIINYYVESTWLDTNDGSILTPFLTIQKAASMIPLNIGNVSYVINIWTWTFTENVLLSWIKWYKWNVRFLWSWTTFVDWFNIAWCNDSATTNSRYWDQIVKIEDLTIIKANNIWDTWEFAWILIMNSYVQVKDVSFILDASWCWVFCVWDTYTKLSWATQLLNTTNLVIAEEWAKALLNYSENNITWTSLHLVSAFKWWVVNIAKEQNTLITTDWFLNYWTMWYIWYANKVYDNTCEVIVTEADWNTDCVDWGVL